MVTHNLRMVQAFELDGVGTVVLECGDCHELGMLALHDLRVGSREMAYTCEGCDYTYWFTMRSDVRKKT